MEANLVIVRKVIHLATLPSGYCGGSTQGEKLLRMQDVHMLRHHVLVKGPSQWPVARELMISRNGVKSYPEARRPVSCSGRRDGRRSTTQPRRVWMSS